MNEPTTTYSARGAQSPPTRLQDFAIERFFAKHEFTARHLLGCSDCQSMSVKEIFDLAAVKNGDSLETISDGMLNLWCGYTETWGDPSLRKLIAQKLYSSNATNSSTRITEDHVLVHSGAEEAIFTVCCGLLQKGDEVIVQSPCYRSSTSIPEFIGASVIEWKMRWDPSRAEWSVDVSELRRIAERCTKLKLLIVNSPHNPTGYHFSKQEFEEIVDIGRKCGVYILSDEVYRLLEYDEASDDPLEVAGKTFRLPGMAELYEKAISLGVMSKSLGLAGLRIGWIASPDLQAMQKIVAVKDYTTICNSAPSEYVAKQALGVSEEIVSRNRNIVLRNRRILTSFMKKHERFLGWDNRSRAGCISFVEVKAPLLDKFGGCEGFCNHLVKTMGVLLVPGYCFGKDFQNFFRLGYGRENFEECLTVLDQFLSDLNTSD